MAKGHNKIKICKKKKKKKKKIKKKKKKKKKKEVHILGVEKIRIEFQPIGCKV